MESWGVGFDYTDNPLLLPAVMPAPALRVAAMRWCDSKSKIWRRSVVSSDQSAAALFLASADSPALGGIFWSAVGQTFLSLPNFWNKEALWKVNMFWGSRFICKYKPPRYLPNFLCLPSGSREFGGLVLLNIELRADIVEHLFWRLWSVIGWSNL